MICKPSLGEHLSLSKQAREKLHWWIQNLILSNGKPLISPPVQLIISSDASNQDWEASCQDQITWFPWSQEEKKSYINVLELKAAKLVTMTLTITKKGISIHVKTDNMVALSYLMKMGDTKKIEINHRQQRNLGLPLIGIAQHLPEVLNVEANDRESRDLRDSSKWKLDPQVFKKTCVALGTPDIDLFTWRVSHQTLQFMSWKLDPLSSGQDGFQISWNQIYTYAFPFLL